RPAALPIGDGVAKKETVFFREIVIASALPVIFPSRLFENVGISSNSAGSGGIGWKRFCRQREEVQIWFDDGRDNRNQAAVTARECVGRAEHLGESQGLLHAFENCEEKRFVLAHRTAKRPAEIVPPEIWDARVSRLEFAVEEIPGIQGAVAEK